MKREEVRTAPLSSARSAGSMEVLLMRSGRGEGGVTEGFGWSTLSYLISYPYSTLGINEFGVLERGCPKDRHLGVMGSQVVFLVLNPRNRRTPSRKSAKTEAGTSIALCTPRRTHGQKRLRRKTADERKTREI